MRQGKNGQIRGTLKRRLMTNFLLTALIPVLIFAIISQINIQKRLKENLSDRIKSNLDTAEKNLEMVLDKYETILYDFSTDEDVLEIVRELNESRGDRESNSTSLRKKLSHICNQFTGVEGITIQLKTGEIIYYESLSSFSGSETWADKVEIPKIERGAVYFGDGKPVKIADKNHYMFYIARNITDYRIIENFQGTVVLSVNEERIRGAIASDIGSREYLLSDDVIVSAPDPKKIGKKLSEIQDSGNYQYTTADHEISGFAICNEQPLAYYWKMSVSQWIYLFIIISMTIVIMFILLHFFSRPYIQAVESITGVMSCVEQGEFDHQVRVNPHLPMEIQQISSGFNEMVAHLEMLIAKVKQAVLDQKNAELSALEAQIDPHFLYNTLNSINWMIRSGKNEEASEMLISLGDLLRAAFKKEQLATVLEELELARHYIDIQKVRYRRRAEFLVEAEGDLEAYHVPRMILQPLVENSINHGVDNSLNKCRILVRVKENVEAQTMTLEVEDDGPGMTEEELEAVRNFTMVPKGNGIGLKNIRERLNLIFSDAVFEITSQPGKGTVVRIEIPKYGGK